MQIFERVYPKQVDDSGVGKIGVFQAVSRHISEMCKTGPRLLLMTNGKSHTWFRLVPKSTTFAPWMTLKAIMHSVSKNVHVSEPTTNICMNIDPYYQRRRCSPMTLVSGNTYLYKVCTDIRGELPGERASNDNGVIENVDFQVFWTLSLAP